MTTSVDGTLGIITTGNVTANNFFGNVNASQVSEGTSAVGFTGVDGDILMEVAGAPISEFTGTGIIVIGNVDPTANSVYNLGNTTNQWKNLWADTVYLDQTPLTMSGGVLQVAGNDVVTLDPLGNLLIPGSLEVQGDTQLVDLAASGNAVVTGNIDAANFNATGKMVAPQFQSNAATGTAPFIVASTTVVANLNADLIDGYDTAILATPSTIAVRDTNGNLSANTYTGNLLQLTGNANVGNLGVSGVIITTGNITGGNIITTGNIEAGVIVTTEITGEDIALTATGTDKDIILTPTGTGTVDTSGKRVTSVADPTGPQDAATKLYVDTVAQGLSAKISCLAATAAPLPAYVYNNGVAGVGASITASASGALVIDGVTVSVNDRVLIKNEIGANESYNGIYEVTDPGSAGTSFVLTRTLDFDEPTQVTGAFVFVNSGTINADSGFVCLTNPPVVIGTTPIQFTQFSGAGNFTAGAGLTLTGTQFSVNVDNTTTAIVGGDVVVKTSAQLTTPNIGVATGTSVVLTGDATAVNIRGTTQVIAPSLVSNVAVGTAPITVISTTRVANLNVDHANVADFGSITTQSTGTFYPTLVSGATTGNFALASNSALSFNAATGQLSSTLLGGTLTTAAQPNITSVGTLTSLAVTGNISSGNLSTGNITLSAGAILSGDGSGLTSLNASNLSTGTVPSARLSGTYTIDIVGAATTAGTVTTAAQPNITSVGTLSGLAVSGSTNLGPVTGVTITGGTVGQVLTTDGSGSLSWTTVSGGGSGVGQIVAGTGITITPLVGTGIVTINASGGGGSYGNAQVSTYLASGTDTAGYVTTGNVNAGNVNATGAVVASTLQSNVATGTAPLTVASTTKVTNLNADLLDGYDSSVPAVANTVVVRDANANVIGNGISGVSLSISGNGVVNGNLLVNGNVVFTNTTQLNISDPIITLGRGANNTPLTINDGKDRGTQLWYYDTSEKSAFFGYDNSTGKLFAAVSATIASDIVTVDNYGNLVVGGLEATTGAFSGAVTFGGVISGDGSGLSALNASNVSTGTLPVARGGTGLTAAGTAGNVLTSDGTNWISSAGGGGGGGGSLTAIASGSLSDGSMVVVNADGTVSVVSALAATLGTQTAFSSVSTAIGSAVYCPEINKVVVVYNASFVGTAVVGTVSGTSISFGTPVVFDSGSATGTSITYVSSVDKVVIAYVDVGNSNLPTAIVGTVSGTSISFGTAVVIDNTLGTATATATQIVSDPFSNKVVVMYRITGGALVLPTGRSKVGTVGASIGFGSQSGWTVGTIAAGTVIRAVYCTATSKVLIAYNVTTGGLLKVGTVSGTSISWSSEFEYQATGISGVSVSLAYCSFSDKVVVSYADGDNTNRGTAFVATVTDDGSVEFGGKFVFDSVAAGSITTTYDSGNDKVIIFYTNAGNTNFVAATVNGTSLSFSTPAVLSSTLTTGIATTYDIINDKVVFIGRNASGFGVGAILTHTTNLTFDNYIGVSSAAYTNGQTATIQLVGSVDDAQSGLIPGKAYYIQNDGTLDTTSDSPLVFAGTAVAATKLIVKG